METVTEKIKKLMAEHLKSKELNQEVIDFLADKIISEAAEQLSSNYTKNPERVAKNITAALIEKANELKL